MKITSLLMICFICCGYASQENFSLSLQNTTKAYFQKTFPGRDITFHTKYEGKQAGCIVCLKDKTSEDFYYVKTHSKGRKVLATDYKPSAVDSKEMFLYKLFELLGLTPEVHFFHDSLTDFYIVTRDAFINSKTGKEGDFLDFMEITWNRNSFVSPLKESISSGREIPGTPVIKRYINSIVLLDLICRIFRVTDTLSHFENIGFFIPTDPSNELPELRVLDFLLDRDYERINDFSFTEKDFIKFKEGIAPYTRTYSLEYRTIEYLLKTRKEEERFRAADQVLSGSLFQDIDRKIDLSYQYINQYIKESFKKEDTEKLLGELVSYKNTIRQNLKFFKQQLKNYGEFREPLREISINQNLNSQS